MRGPVRIKLRPKRVQLFVEGGDRTTQPLISPNVRVIKARSWTEDEVFGQVTVTPHQVNLVVVANSFVEGEVFEQHDLHPAPFVIPPYEPFTNLCGNPIYLADFIPSLNDADIHPNRTFHWIQVGGDPVVVLNEFSLFGARFNRDIENDDKVFELIVDEGTSYETRWLAYCYFTPTSNASTLQVDYSTRRTTTSGIDLYTPGTGNQPLPTGGVYKIGLGNLGISPIFYGSDYHMIGRVDLYKEVGGVQTLIDSVYPTEALAQTDILVGSARHVNFYNISEPDNTKFIIKFYGKVLNNNRIDSEPFFILNDLYLPKATGSSDASNFPVDEVSRSFIVEDISIQKILSLELFDVISNLPVNTDHNLPSIYSEDILILIAIYSETNDASSGLLVDQVRPTTIQTLDILIVGGIAIGG